MLSHLSVVPDAVLALEQGPDPIEFPPQVVLGLQLLAPDRIPDPLFASSFAE